MANKYELVNEDYIDNGIKAYSIKSLKTGEIGGDVMGYENLSQEGNCWIEENCAVYDNSTVQDDAMVCGKLRIEGNVTISRKAHIHSVENCDIADEYNNGSIITDNAHISLESKDSWIVGTFKISGNVDIVGSPQINGKTTITDSVKIDGSPIINDCTISDSVLIEGNPTLKNCTISDNVIIKGNPNIKDCVLLGKTVIIGGSDLEINSETLENQTIRE